MKIGFLIRKARTNRYSICCRISFDYDKGIPFVVKGLTVDKKEDWINVRGKPLQILGPGAKKKMLVLNQLELDLIDIFERQQALDYPITSAIITELYFGNRKPPLTVLNVFRNFTDQQHKRKIGKEAKGKYERAFLDFQTFCKKRKIGNLPAEKFSTSLAKEYNQFLISSIGNNEPTSWRKVRTLKKAINEAAGDEIIQSSKLSDLIIDVHNEKKAIVFLLQDELERIENKVFEIERLENVRLCFLFCCYTGFHFNQMQIFDVKKHLFEQNGKLWISTERDKNGNYIGIPVFPKTLAILEKCNYKLPIISNGNFNSYLKEIADLCQIYKNLTSKVGRKTFANMCLNVYGFSKGVVARMLGHDSVTTTEKHYGDIDQNTILREAEHLF